MFFFNLLVVLVNLAAAIMCAFAGSWVLAVINVVFLVWNIADLPKSYRNWRNLREYRKNFRKSEALSR